MIPQPPDDQPSEAAALLEPVGAAIEGVRTLFLLGTLAVLLVLAGARLERCLLKRRLEVLDGAAEGSDVDLTEGTGGGRS